tara:strand:- start:115 stop:339 length:225 start_codon:yes stop_codon:yes gene_type:complete
MKSITKTYNRIAFKICHTQCVPIERYEQDSASICLNDNDTIKISDDINKPIEMSYSFLRYAKIEITSIENRAIR